MKRRRRVQKNKAYVNDDILNPHVFNEYNGTYGSPTVVGSEGTNSRPMSTVGAKARPFVQAYNPTANIEHYETQPPYYPEYPTNYGQTHNNYGYEGGYYQEGGLAEPMIVPSGRNVPDEADYPRHVPDEKDSTPPARKA